MWPSKPAFLSYNVAPFLPEGANLAATHRGVISRKGGLQALAQTRLNGSWHVLRTPTAGASIPTAADSTTFTQVDHCMMNVTASPSTAAFSGALLGFRVVSARLHGALQAAVGAGGAVLRGVRPATARVRQRGRGGRERDGPPTAAPAAGRGRGPRKAGRGPLPALRATCAQLSALGASLPCTEGTLQAQYYTPFGLPPPLIAPAISQCARQPDAQNSWKPSLQNCPWAAADPSLAKGRMHWQTNKIGCRAS